VPMPALERYGVRMMSLGLLAGEEQALLTGQCLTRRTARPRVAHARRLG
jgi:hypothetical protein